MVQFDEAGIILCFYFLVIQSLWLFLTAVIMNLIAIRFGSQNGFIATVGIQVTFMTILLLWEKVLPLENSDQIARNGFLLKWNPISHLFLNWHSSKYEAVDKVIHNFKFSFDLDLSVLVLFSACMILLCIGCIIIKQYDLIVSDVENG